MTVPTVSTYCNEFGNKRSKARQRKHSKLDHVGSFDDKSVVSAKV